MRTNDHQIRDYSAELDRKYGAVGTKERELFEEEAWNFYSARKRPGTSIPARYFKMPAKRQK